MSLGDVVHGGDARAAAHTDHGAFFFNVRGMPQRAADVRNGVAFLEGFQQGRAFAQNQIDDGDGAVGRISVGNGQGNALARGGHAQHDEVARVRLLGDVRRVQDQFAGFARDQAFLVQNGCRHMLSCAAIGLWRQTGVASSRQGCNKRRNTSRCPGGQRAVRGGGASQKPRFRRNNLHYRSRE